MFKKIAMLAASLILATSAVAGPLGTTAKVNGGNTTIGLDNATRVTFASGAVTVHLKGGVQKYYTDYANGAKNLLTASPQFKEKFANSTATDWVNASVGEFTCTSGATLVTYFSDNTQEYIYDGCAGAAAVKQAALQ